jgi:hypothetical protein
LRRIKQCLGVLALTGLAAAGIGAGSASAATRPISTRAQWQAALAQVAQPGAGCYHASYPVLRWHAVKCVAAPTWPLAPARSAGRANRAAPNVVGNGKDYSAVVSGTISKATGSFTHVNSTISEKGQPGGTGSKVPNGFSLQLNSQFFKGSPACSGSGTPTKCEAWQQFVYTYQNSSTGYIFMQYWLINYNGTCPAGWMAYSTDCYTNSNASLLPGGPLKAKQLGKLKLAGSATSGGNDVVSLTLGTQATSVSNADSEIDLARSWNTTEWGVYGDGGGSEAFFSAHATLEAQTLLKATSSSAPTCVAEGFTGETNNLNLITTPALGSEPSPTMASKQTNGGTSTPSCATAS